MKTCPDFDGKRDYRSQLNKIAGRINKEHKGERECVLIPMK